MAGFSIFFLAILMTQIYGGRGCQQMTIRPALHAANYTSGEYDFSIWHGGRKRKYLVHVPLSYRKGIPMPLVMAFHGGAGNAAASVKFFGLNQLADREGFIVAYPEGTGKRNFGRAFGTWNAGRCCPPAMDHRVDDIGFLAKMIRKLKLDFSIDPHRVYATGHSNGALIAYRMACELSDEIAAIAVGGAHDAFDECRPTEPVSIMHFHGLSDRCAKFEGGQCGGCFGEYLRAIGIPAEDKHWDCVSVPAYIAEWRMMNGCGGQSEITYQKGSATCRSYRQCQADSEVVLCTIEGAGHTWPGGDYENEACESDPNGKRCRLWRDMVGELTYDFVATEEAWKFFKRHPKEEV